MNSTPLISVITVCLNNARFIEGCIESVLDQDYSDYEYVVIDGGSDDGTVDIIKKYQDKMSYWHSKTDRGLSDAFNQGIENSRGEWLLFVNSDDCLAGPTILSRMARVLQDWPKADVVLGQVMLMTREHYPQVKSGPHGKHFSWNELRFNAIVPHQAAFTNRDYFNKIGLFDERYRILVDYEHFLRGGPDLAIHFVPIVVSLMRDGGLSKKDINKGLLELKQAQIETRALPPAVAEINRIYLLVRHFLGRTFIGKPWRTMRNRRLRRAHSIHDEKTFYESK